MARPERNNVDYFPFYCEEGKKMFYLEETYGNDGFATFLKLLRELAKTEYHYLDLSKNTTMMFLSAKCKVSKELLETIINDLVDLEKFDAVLWNENKIIWCQDFINSIEDAYVKRKNKCITYQGLLLRLQGLGVRKPSKCPTKAPVNPQSKVEYNKVKQIKEIDVIEYDDKIIELVYHKDHFLQNWNEVRNFYLKTPSNLNRLRPEENDLFNSIKLEYKKEDFHNALNGLFKQERVPVEIMWFKPKHLLENIDTYIDANKNKKYKLYA